MFTNIYPCLVTDVKIISQKESADLYHRQKGSCHFFQQILNKFADCFRDVWKINRKNGETSLWSKLQVSQYNPAWKINTTGCTMIRKKAKGKKYNLLIYILRMPSDLAQN